MNEEETDSIQVVFRAQVFHAGFPGRYLITLEADGIDSGLRVTVWGVKRATKTADAVLANASALLNDLGLAQELAAKVYMNRPDDEAAEGVKLVNVNDTVRLLVDIGPYKRGRVFRVVEVAQSTGYTARGGATEWDDLHFPIKVVPVSSMPGEPILSAKDGIPLAADEFCPGDKEVD